MPRPRTVSAGPLKRAEVVANDPHASDREVQRGAVEILSRLLGVPLAAVVAALVVGCTAPTEQPPAVEAPMPHACVAQGSLPDRACTPGEIDTSATLAVVCGTSTRTRRHVTPAMRRRVLAAYGIPLANAHRYELDHLVSLEIGGANIEANLWPEPIDDARAKDVVENRTHRLVCSGAVSLEDAQRAFASDWTRVPW